MFLLDTHVVSELRKARDGKADRNVLRWANAQDASELFLSVISLEEIERGVLLAERRDPRQGAMLRTWLETHVIPAFADRLLSVDASVTRRSAAIQVPDRRPEADALIAATALVHGLKVATRNVTDFAPTGVEVVNPWE